MKTLATYTLGCKVNIYDTEAIAKLFTERGYQTVDFDGAADVYIINTCTVTNLSDKKSRQIIRRCKKHNPGGIVVVMGCYAQVAPGEVKEIEGVNIIIGTKDRKNIVDIIEGYKSDMPVLDCVTKLRDDEAFENLAISSFQGKTRAFLKIQDGCDRFCTYCIIPYARGAVRSRQPADVIEEARRLAKNGFKEIVLAGIHVASYGKDLVNADLLKLIERIHEIDGIKRIRLSSIDPGAVNARFVNTLSGLPKVCDHFHLSLQSGCDKTLKAMGRRYTKEQYSEAVLLLRNSFKDVALTTDIISGFPGETDADFLESYEFAEKTGFSKIHGFSYSPREGTKAAGFENQIPNSVKDERNRKITALSNKLAYQFRNKFNGRKMDVLYESVVDDNTYVGYTTNYIKVETVSDVDLVNEIKAAEL